MFFSSILSDICVHENDQVMFYFDQFPVVS